MTQQSSEILKRQIAHEAAIAAAEDEPSGNDRRKRRVFKRTFDSVLASLYVLEEYYRAKAIPEPSRN